jgi:hypothetical protein
VDVVFQGALSDGRGMPELLRALQSIPELPFGVLRITAADGSTGGRLLVADSSLIVGAALTDGGLTGYDAAKCLLAIRSGNIAYLNGGPARPPGFDGELCLSIQRVLASWPDLPENAAELFDQNSLLDRVFGAAGGHQGTAPAVAEPRQLPEEPVAARSGPPSSEQEVWKFLQPLLSGTPNLSMQLGDDEDFFQNISSQDISGKRTSLSKLRGERAQEGAPWYKQLLRDALAPTKAIFWLLLVFAISTAMTFLVNSAFRQNIFTKFHNSLTIQKGALPQTGPDSTASKSHADQQ